MMQVGGVLRGKGKYGCTFEPLPRCAGGSVFKTIGGRKAVGKITSEDATSELKIGQAIMSLPMANNYFALPSVACRPELPLQDPDAADCEFIAEAGEGSTLTMLIMPSAGEPLYEWAQDLPLLAEHYSDIAIHLLEGMIIYQRAGFVHNDIHMSNILVDANNVPRYIDFGLSYRPADVQQWSDCKGGMTFRPNYPWTAPEMHAWRMQANGQSIIKGVDQLRKINKEYITLQESFARPPTDIELQKFINETPKKDIEFLRTYGLRADSWRIGLMFWMLWGDLLVWSGFDNTDLWQVRDRIRKMIDGLTQFDPRKRITPAAALAILDPNNRLANGSA